MRILLAILLFTSVAADAYASKCKAKFFEISGRVIDAAGNPLAYALVGASWSVDTWPSGPSVAMANERGEYVIPVRVAPLACGIKEYLFSVTAFSPTHRSQAETLSAVEGGAIAVPLLQVTQEIETEPVWTDEVGA